MSDRRDEPDIEIGASAHAKQVRFKQKPRTHIEYRGEPEIEHWDGDTRENLPDEVEPGVTYRDVHIRWGAAARLKMPPELEERDEDGDEK